MKRPTELNIDWIHHPRQATEGKLTSCQGCGEDFAHRAAKIEEYFFCPQCVDEYILSQWKEYAIYLESQQAGGKRDKLFRPIEWRAARDEHYKHSPEKGHYWWAERFHPVLVVLAVLPSHVVVCRKTTATHAVLEHQGWSLVDDGNNKWSWDVSECDLMSRKDFVDLLERLDAELSDCKHTEAVKEFEGLAALPENAI